MEDAGRREGVRLGEKRGMGAATLSAMAGCELDPRQGRRRVIRRLLAS